jgi:CDP-6-deoxy-D-xylo-4-hexulose-3-dehydrase
VLEPRDPDAMRAQIIDLVREYHDAAFGHDRPFVPGETKLSYAGRVFDAEEIVALVDSSLDFWLTYGRYSRRFESEFADFLGLREALLVNSGSSANLLAFACLTSERFGERRIGGGDEVITVAAGFPTTVTPIIQYGAVPVFVDVTLPTYNVDVDALEAALSARTKAVMLAHTLGNPFDIGAVTAFCERHGLWLVEDNCDALGALYNGRLTGTFGDVGTSSFYPPHHMTMGEGGAVYAADPAIHRVLLSMRDWGRDCVCPSGVDDVCGRRFERQSGTLPAGYDHKYVYSEFGYNLKATDMQAAVGCAQLAKLPSFIEARRRNFDTLVGLLRPLEDRIVLPEATPNSEPSWFGCLMTVRNPSATPRDQITRHLESCGVQTRNLFAGNLVRQPCFDAMRASGEGFRVVGGLENTDRIMSDSFWVGVYPGLDDERLAYMAGALRDALDGCGR